MTLSIFWWFNRTAESKKPFLRCLTPEQNVKGQLFPDWLFPCSDFGSYTENICCTYCSLILVILVVVRHPLPFLSFMINSTCPKDPFTLCFPFIVCVPSHVLQSNSVALFSHSKIKTYSKNTSLMSSNRFLYYNKSRANCHLSQYSGPLHPQLINANKWINASILLLLTHTCAQLKIYKGTSLNLD